MGGRATAVRGALGLQLTHIDDQSQQADNKLMPEILGRTTWAIILLLASPVGSLPARKKFRAEHLYGSLKGTE